MSCRSITCTYITIKFFRIKHTLIFTLFSAFLVSLYSFSKSCMRTPPQCVYLRLLPLSLRNCRGPTSPIRRRTSSNVSTSAGFPRARCGCSRIRSFSRSRLLYKTDRLFLFPPLVLHNVPDLRHGLFFFSGKIKEDARTHPYWVIVLTPSRNSVSGFAIIAYETFPDFWL